MNPPKLTARERSMILRLGSWPGGIFSAPTQELCRDRSEFAALLSLIRKGFVRRRDIDDIDDIDDDCSDLTGAGVDAHSAISAAPIPVDALCDAADLHGIDEQDMTVGDLQILLGVAASLLAPDQVRAFWLDPAVAEICELTEYEGLNPFVASESAKSRPGP